MIDLKELREKKGYTQESLAKEIGVKRSAIANIECGFNKPSIPLAKKIAKVLEFEWTLFF